MKYTKKDENVCPGESRYLIHIILMARQCIVIGGKWFGSSANIKGACKDAKIYVGKSTTVHNLLFCAHTLCINYVTNTIVLVSSLIRSKQLLCFVHGQGQKREQKPTTKKFVGFHNHSPLLTMVNVSIIKSFKNATSFEINHFRDFILFVVDVSA